MKPPEPKSIYEQLMTIARASALEEMASGVAHELNQPLGAIAAYAQAGERMLSRNAPLVGEAADVMRQITQEAIGAAEGIRRIRRILTSDESCRRPCLLPQLLEELTPLLQTLATSSGNRLQIEILPDRSAIRADALRIQHVIFTLVQNALEWNTPCETAELLPVQIVVGGDRYMAELSVHNFGNGIASEARHHVFRPFFTTRSDSVGLALASSRAIIESHGGEIGFESVLNGRTRFWFRLPVDHD